MFAAVRDELKKDVYTYVAVVGFALCCAAPFLAEVFGLPSYSTLTIGVAAGYLLFLPIGYLLSHYEMGPRAKVAVYVLGLLGLLMHITGTYVLSMEAGEVVSTFKGYTNLPCVMYSVAVFVLLRDVGTRVMVGAAAGRVMRSLGRYTFAVYLLHWYAVQVMKAIPWADTYSIFYRLFGCVPIVAAVVMVTWALRKVPLMRKVLP